MTSRSNRGSNNPSLTRPPYAPQPANGSVLLAGLMGLRPNNNPAISSSFATGQNPGLGRRPTLSKRLMIGGQ